MRAPDMIAYRFSSRGHCPGMLTENWRMRRLNSCVTRVLVSGIIL